MFRNRVHPLIIQAVAELQREGALPGFSIPEISVAVPGDPAHGDYATNAAFAVAKAAGRPPMEVADLVAKRLKAHGAGVVADAQAAAPGFINITLADSLLAGALDMALREPDRWWRSDVGRGKTIRVEYFQLNIAKRPHIGHLRSAVIGDAIKRMLLASGYRTVSDTHVGDWGTQFGILLYALKQVKDPLVMGVIEGDPLNQYEVLYSLYSGRGVFSEMVKQGWAQPTTDWEHIHERGKEEFVKLERGDPENRRIWKRIVDISMEKLKEIASRLDLHPFDMHCGESFYEAMMPEIVERALAKDVAKKTADGAVVVELAAEGLDEAVLIKSDGASTYLLRDLATLKYMQETLYFAENLYVVDVRQSLHFQQVFRIAELLGIEGDRESRHIEFGFMALPEGPLSTRKGTAISLNLLLFEATTRASTIIKEKNPNLKERDVVAETVGLGAIKYFDLSHHRKSDIIFRWDEALAFEGNTGPYLQYTHARLKSILRRAAAEAKVPERVKLDDIERRLAAAMARLPEAVEDALKDYTPNTLANYLYGLAQSANEFYHSHPVIQEPDERKRQFRVALVAGVADTLKRGLDLLGIAAPEEM